MCVCVCVHLQIEIDGNELSFMNKAQLNCIYKIPSEMWSVNNQKGRKYGKSQNSRWNNQIGYQNAKHY